MTGPSYRIEQSLGEGGLGRSLLAKRADGTSVVLRVPMVRRPESIDAVRRELALLQALKGPAFVNLLDVTELEGKPVGVFEHVEGLSLAQMQKAGPMSPGATASFGRQLAEALALLHQALAAGPGPERSHGDVQPASVLVDVQGNVKLLHLGLALSSSGTGTRRAAVRYHAPLDEVSPAADFFALGVVVFEARTGRRAAVGADALVRSRMQTGDFLKYLPGESPCPPLDQILVELAKPSAERLSSGEAVAQRFAQAEQALAVDGKSELAAFVRRARTGSIAPVEPTVTGLKPMPFATAPLSALADATADRLRAPAMVDISDFDGAPTQSAEGEALDLGPPLPDDVPAPPPLYSDELAIPQSATSLFFDDTASPDHSDGLVPTSPGALMQDDLSRVPTAVGPSGALADLMGTIPSSTGPAEDLAPAPGAPATAAPELSRAPVPAQPLPAELTDMSALAAALRDTSTAPPPGQRAPTATADHDHDHDGAEFLLALPGRASPSSVEFNAQRAATEALNKALLAAYQEKDLSATVAPVSASEAYLRQSLDVPQPATGPPLAFGGDAAITTSPRIVAGATIPTAAPLPTSPDGPAMPYGGLQPVLLTEPDSGPRPKTITQSFYTEDLAQSLEGEAVDRAVQAVATQRSRAFVVATVGLVGLGLCGFVALAIAFVLSPEEPTAVAETNASPSADSPRATRTDEPAPTAAEPPPAVAPGPDAGLLRNQDAGPADAPAAALATTDDPVDAAEDTVNDDDTGEEPDGAEAPVEKKSKKKKAKAKKKPKKKKVKRAPKTR